MRILYVEDDLTLASSLQFLLKDRHRIDIAKTVSQALRFSDRYNYQVYLIDYLLPDGSGLDLITDIRSSGCDQPLLLITGEQSPELTITALSQGADDCLTKPFLIDELNLRLMSALQRSGDLPKGNTIYCDQISLDINQQTARYKNQIIPFKRKEYLVFELLMLRSNQIVSREIIHQNVWQDGYYDSNTIDVHIRRIRNKLRQFDQREYIQTLYGFGYRLINPTATNQTGSKP